MNKTNGELEKATELWRGIKEHYLHWDNGAIECLAHALREHGDRIIDGCWIELKHIEQELMGRKHWTRYWESNGQYIAKRILALKSDAGKEATMGEEGK